MGITGSDVTKDSAAMVLLDDDFSSIVNGIEEGRKIFDNLKKTIVYILASNIVEICPVFAFVILGVPLPISSIFMLCIDVGTDILPAISLAYEEIELDVMTRPPRKKTDHLVTAKLMYHAYALQSVIQAAGAFLAYFGTMHYYGFDFIGLRGMVHKMVPTRPLETDLFNLDNATFGNS